MPGHGSAEALAFPTALQGFLGLALLLQSHVLWQFLHPIPSYSCFRRRGRGCGNARKSVLSTFPRVLVFQTSAN